MQAKKVHPISTRESLVDHENTPSRLSQCSRSWSQSHISALKIFVGTWNMNGKVPKAKTFPFNELQVTSKPSIDSSSKRSSIISSDYAGEYPYNIIAIGCQEARHTQKFKRWLDGCIKEYEEGGYRLAKLVKMGSLSLIVLVAWWMLTGIQIQFGNATKNMFNRIFGNKGATYVRIEFKGMSLLFVNCHFSAHQEKVSERRKDYLKLSAIISKRFPVGIPPPPQSPSATSDDAGIIDQFDCMFWLGDLNYRVNGTRRIVDALISRKDQDIMLGNDQLSLEMKKGHVLSGFHEAAPISFPPTFKFDVFKTKRLQAKRKQVDILENNEEGVKTPINVYDTSIKSRIPSWTDRILYASRKDGRVTCSKYDSEMGAMESDHKPVFALFDVAI